MVSINTNLSSLIIQNNLSKSTNALNLAIERMTTGFKINHAGDNAANYSISQNIVSELSSYDVATQNIGMGLDMVQTAEDSITLMQNHADRVMDLWTQAQNGTYGEESLKAIQAEVNARLQEIDRLYQNTEFNGIKLFDYNLPEWAETVKANAGLDESTPRHHVDDSAVNGYTHVASLTSFESGQTYAITTVEDLANLAAQVNAGADTTNVTFIMGANLDLSSYCAEHMNSDGEGGWDAIGNSHAKKFNGSFDGNGHTISGLTIKKDESYQGLFGIASSTSTIKNVGVEGVNVTGGIETGGLIGYSNGNITNCYSTGTVSGTEGADTIGGLAGLNNYGNITNSYSSCTVSGDVAVGGLAGSVYLSNITNCYATGNVIGGVVGFVDSFGGLVGSSITSNIESCYSTGEVSGKENVGGLVGGSMENTITNSYSTSVVSGESDVGGLIGLDMEGSSELSNTISLDDINPELTLQVGINGNDSSSIVTNTHIGSTLKISNITSKDAYNQIKEFIDKLSSKATELGAISNRLESSLESTTVAMENLTSSLSTIRDADIAQVSSDYIRQQILQQASATLLATANQTPAIALQLL